MKKFILKELIQILKENNGDLFKILNLILLVLLKIIKKFLIKKQMKLFKLKTITEKLLMMMQLELLQ